MEKYKVSKEEWRRRRVRAHVKIGVFDVFLILALLAMWNEFSIVTSGVAADLPAIKTSSIFCFLALVGAPFFHVVFHVCARPERPPKRTMTVLWAIGLLLILAGFVSGLFLTGQLRDYVTAHGYEECEELSCRRGCTVYVNSAGACPRSEQKKCNASSG